MACFVVVSAMISNSFIMLKALALGIRFAEAAYYPKSLIICQVKDSIINNVTNINESFCIHGKHNE